jgi:hypothetical protein
VLLQQVCGGKRWENTWTSGGKHTHWTLTRPNQQPDFDKDTNSAIRTLKLTNAEAMARKVLWREQQVWLWAVGWRSTLKQRGNWCEPDGIPLLWLPHDTTWVPNLPKGLGNYRFGRIRDTPIRLQIQRNEPCNLSTMNPMFINQAAARLTLPRRLTLACEIKEHKQVHGEESKSQKVFDSTHEWGSTTEESVSCYW